MKFEIGPNFAGAICFAAACLAFACITLDARGDSISLEAAPEAWELWTEDEGGRGIELAGASTNSIDCFDISCDCAGCDSTTSEDGWIRQLCSQPALTNGLFGLQAPLAESGIAYQAYLTQFYQGVASGGRSDDFRYGGKVDQFLVLDSKKLGLWEGGSLVLHAETRYGQDVNRDAVGLAPVNANMLYPASDSVTAITGLLLNQALSEEWMVSAGTYNQLDLFNQIYPQTGRGVDGFMNISALLPLSVVRQLNLSMLGASVTQLNEGRVQGTLAVFNTANATTSSSFDKLFVNGAVVLGYYRLFTNFGDLPGSHALLGVYSSGTYTSVDPTTWVILPDLGVIVPGRQQGSWSLTYLYEKKLWMDSTNPARNLGLLTTWGLSDGNPDPIGWSGNVALQGTGLNARRPGDAVGVAYFHTALSGDFKRLASPLVNLQDIDGVELYYNAAITPWFHLTPDLQVITPANQALDTALVIGLRGKITL